MKISYSTHYSPAVKPKFSGPSILTQAGLAAGATGVVNLGAMAADSLTHRPPSVLNYAVTLISLAAGAVGLRKLLRDKTDRATTNPS